MSKVLYGWFDSTTCMLFGCTYKNGYCTRCGKKKK